MPHNPAGHTELPPHAQLVQMATAHWMSHILYAAAKLNLADHLAQGPKRRRTSSAYEDPCSFPPALHADTRTPRARR
jgi:hypothetical protein